MTSILFILFLFLAVYAQTDDLLIVRISVVDEDYNPVQGAKVTISPEVKEFEYREYGQTDVDGLATFEVPRAVKYRIFVESAGYSSTVIPVDLTENPPKKVLTVTAVLVKPSEMGQLITQISNQVIIIFVGIVIFVIIIVFVILKRRKQTFKSTPQFPQHAMRSGAGFGL